MEERNGLRVLRASDPQLLRALEGAVRLGAPVLLEGLSESLEPALEPLLLRQTYTQVGGAGLWRLRRLPLAQLRVQPALFGLPFAGR